MNSESDADFKTSYSEENKHLPPASPSLGDTKSPASDLTIGKSLEKTEQYPRKGLVSGLARAVKLHVDPADFARTVQELTGNVRPKDFQRKVKEIGRAQSGVAEDLFPLISHCFSLFPSGSEFAKQDLVTLWIAEGLSCLGSVHFGRELEDVADDIFDSLVSRHVIVPSRYDKSLDFFNPKLRNLLYKVNESSSFPSSARPARLSNSSCATVSDNNFDHVPETIMHLCVQCKSAYQMNFEAINRFVHLRTLFIIPSSCGFSVAQIPRDLFLRLKHLRSLNLSRSRVSELPNSIGNLKSLMYIDLSYTPIKHLPDSMDTLHNLQTLKLRFCLNLVALPKGTSKLTNLRHLDLDVLRQLNSMPNRMGNLANLRTLSAFLVGKDDGKRIVELKNIAKLTGAFCISRLENVSSFEEAKEAGLINKRFLKILELRWSDNRRINNDNVIYEEEKILEHLQPPLRIECLRILHYCGFKLPSWISNLSYSSLVDITLFGCRNSQFLPSIGELPSLQFLNIKEMNELKRINHRLCRKEDYGPQSQAFPRLQKLTIEAMPKLEEWTGIQNGDFPVLHTLKVEYCPQLTSLPLLSHLDSLKHLELNYCQSFLSLPDQDLPPSVEFFLMRDCPQLKKRCHKGEGQDWGKIAHVHNILIDYEKISWQVNMPED